LNPVTPAPPVGIVTWSKRFCPRLIVVCGLGVVSPVFPTYVTTTQYCVGFRLRFAIVVEPTPGLTVGGLIGPGNVVVLRLVWMVEKLLPA
jgi:hypothetical protein